MRTGSSVRSVGSFLAGVGGNGGAGLLGELVGVFLGVGGGIGGSRLLADFVVLDDVDAHVGQHRHGVLDLLGGHFLGGQHRIEFVHGDIAALLGGLDHLLDGVIGKVEQRSIGTGFTFGLGLFLFLCRHTFAVSKRPDADLPRRGRSRTGAVAARPALSRHERDDCAFKARLTLISGRSRLGPSSDQCFRPVDLMVAECARGLPSRIVLIPPFRRKVKRLSHDSRQKSESFAVSPAGAPRGDAEALDQGVRRLGIPQLRLDVDEVTVVLVGRIGGQRRFGRLELPM